MGQRKYMSRKSLKYFEINEINTTFQNLWGTAKMIPTVKFIAFNAYIRNEEI